MFDVVVTPSLCPQLLLLWVCLPASAPALAWSLYSRLECVCPGTAGQLPSWNFPVPSGGPTPWHSPLLAALPSMPEGLEQACGLGPPGGSIHLPPNSLGAALSPQEDAVPGGTFGQHLQGQWPQQQLQQQNTVSAPQGQQQQQQQQQQAQQGTGGQEAVAAASTAAGLVRLPCLCQPAIGCFLPAKCWASSRARCRCTCPACKLALAALSQCAAVCIFQMVVYAAMRKPSSVCTCRPQLGSLSCAMTCRAPYRQRQGHSNTRHNG